MRDALPEIDLGIRQTFICAERNSWVIILRKKLINGHYKKPLQKKLLLKEVGNLHEIGVKDEKNHYEFFGPVKQLTK
ncbi:hypothetical protein ACQKOF_04120 [Lysinibacillus sp. NPDC093190]|uniref:hypothetical protein n=1 Tax=Lysinibacillus sp. NPDC093190 TaxID=3390575 RepID=UPI003D0521F5